MLIFCYNKARAEEVRDKLRKKYRMTATEASKELIWINQLRQDLSIPSLLNELSAPILYIDNQTALSLAKNPTDHNHIDIRYHFIRSEVAAGTLNLQSIGTKENIADILTKALPKATFEAHTFNVVWLHNTCILTLMTPSTYPHPVVEGQLGLPMRG